MNDIKESEKYIKDLKSKIKKETETVLESNLENRAMPDSYSDLQNKNIYNLLIKAEQNANIGANLPSLDKLFFLKRIIYKWAIRFVFKVLRVITINQGQFNLSVLEILRTYDDIHGDFILRTANDKTQAAAKLMEQEIRLKNLNDEMCHLKKNMDYLKNSLMQLGQKTDDSHSDKTDIIIGKTSRKERHSITRRFNNDLDPLYVFLEDNLRGSREEIKNRLKVYLPILKKANAGSINSPILDIGCGRGEWLELLKEQNFNATGVDVNKIMVKICKDLKLNVIEEEGVDYLKNIKDGSIGAITGFHLIEHYEFDFLIELFNESFRVLKPGGIIIFETPNPDNILVGSCNFYLDPTHNKPLPSLLVKLLLEARGFGDISIMNLHPVKVISKIEDDSSINLKIIYGHFFGAQDYGIIGYKE